VIDPESENDRRWLGAVRFRKTGDGQRRRSHGNHMRVI
jgi:hypothetical protein